LVSTCLFPRCCLYTTIWLPLLHHLLLVAANCYGCNIHRQSRSPQGEGPHIIHPTVNISSILSNIHTQTGTTSRELFSFFSRTFSITLTVRLYLEVELLKTQPDSNIKTGTVLQHSKFSEVSSLFQTNPLCKKYNHSLKHKHSL
jgi:hypothetical protein